MEDLIHWKRTEAITWTTRGYDSNTRFNSVLAPQTWQVSRRWHTPTGDLSKTLKTMLTSSTYSRTINQFRLKVRTVIYHQLQRNRNSSCLQFEVVYWLALAAGSTAHLEATHCPDERTLDPNSAARQTHLCPSQPHPAVLWQRLTILVVSNTGY